MIYIGIDPGLSSTGIVVLRDGALWASLNITHAVVKKKRGEKVGKFVSCFIDKPSPVITNSFPLKYTYPIDQQSDIRQLKTFYTLSRQTFEYLSQTLAPVKNMFGLERCKIALEIPMGHHMGAGAKVDRMFAVLVLAVMHAAPLQIARGTWDVYSFRPTEIKKFTTGKGNSPKPFIVKEVFKRWGFETLILDVADAFAIAKYLENYVTEA